MRQTVWGLLGLPMVLFCLAGSALAADVAQLSGIVVPGEPTWQEQMAAKVVQEQLKQHYQLDLPIIEGGERPGPADRPVILLGRGPAIAWDLVTEAELEKVKHDGYIVKAAGNVLVAAGYRPLGTLYAAGGLLEKLGIRYYSGGRHQSSKVVFSPLKSTTLEAFSFSTKPYFEYRGLARSQDLWAIGSSSTMDVGDPRTNALNPEIFSRAATKERGDGNWIVSDHVAGYLVPQELYFDEHPEYFAAGPDGQRTRQKIWHRVTLCLGNPAVSRIAGERMLGWMDLQNDKRIFHAFDGDTGACMCPLCRAKDIHPRYVTDRNLGWVNAIARGVQPEHADKWILGAAYLQTAKPPAAVKLEPNVGVLYAPWYWTSANTRVVTWAHPRNITAMEEFMGWSVKFPNQMGVYNYPGVYLWLRGGVDLLKWEAKNRVKFVYYDGGPGMFAGLWAHVMGKLNWDPLLDSGVLEEEYVRAYYGTAAGPILEYLAIHHAASHRQFGALFKDPELLTRGRELLLSAQALADKSDDADLKKRVDQDVNAWMSEYAKAVPQAAAQPAPEATAHVLPEERRAPADAAGDAEARRPAARKSVMVVEFKSPADAADARATSSTPELVSEVVLAPATTPVSTNQVARGISIALPFDKLPIKSIPIHPEGRNRLHAGWFLLQKHLSKPVDISGCDFIEFRLHVSSAMPATLVVGLGGTPNISSDVRLGAGEQIVRMDLRGHAQGSWREHKDKWDGTITHVAVKFLPADNVYPHPDPGRAPKRATLISVTARDHDRTAGDLPYAGQAIYLTQYRSNVGHGIPPEVDAKCPVWGYGERFRTTTDHAALSPLMAIVTGDDASEPLQAAAKELQSYLHKLHGVRLPINPPGLASAGPDSGNVIILGRQEGLRSGAVTEQELKHVGSEGFVIRAQHGRIVIAGASDQSTAFGVARYLEDHGVRFFQPGVREVVPDQRAGFLHELYLLDWPYFARHGLGGGWKLYSSAPMPSDVRQTRSTDAASAVALGDTIKDCARHDRGIPAEVLAQAAASPLHRYVAAKLLWDPYLDTSRLIKEFQSE
ncbi:MAG: DUF4838 domain-containing protein [Phycisphaeraceae bacterium]